MGDWQGGQDWSSYNQQDDWGASQQVYVFILFHLNL